MRSALLILFLASVAQADTPWLTMKDITYVFIGREVAGHYRNGAEFSEIYRRIGKVEYKDKDGAAAGTWMQKQDQFCMQYDNAPGGCYRIRMQGDNCFEYWLVGEDEENAAEWIARSWQVKYPSTCPKDADAGT